VSEEKRNKTKKMLNIRNKFSLLRCGTRGNSDIVIFMRTCNTPGQEVQDLRKRVFDDHDYDHVNRMRLRL
jgi:hypothetical protein